MGEMGGIYPLKLFEIPLKTTLFLLDLTDINVVLKYLLSSFKVEIKDNMPCF